MNAASTDVLFAVLPFAAPEHPALGVSLLQAALNARGLSSRVSYFNLDLAEEIGLELYNALEIAGRLVDFGDVHLTRALTGEWFFADVAFPDRLPSAEEYVEKFLRPDSGRRRFIDRIVAARRKNRAFVERWAAGIRNLNPKIVGFTTVFDQTCACLSVAKALKEGPDPPVIVFGGSNCEGEMGHQLIQSFPWIDYVCTGEGDEVFPSFAEQLIRGGRAPAIPGILARGDAFSMPGPVVDLDALPFPDFSDYFERLRSSPLYASMRVELMFESSRGCWWGEKQHCTFCGLNGGTMKFRSKSAGRVIDELTAITTESGCDRVQCADNILDLNYFHTLFPQLIGSSLNLSLFYETKANLKFEQLQLLKAANVKTILPGIESLSNQLLRLMRKGSTGLQNLRLLRWCEELGIDVIWYCIYGFPGESPAELDRVSELIPSLTHLQPAQFCLPIQLERFSPYFFQARELGIANIRPAAAYTYSFPLTAEELMRLGYFFDFDYADGREPLHYSRKLVEASQAWYRLSSQPENRPSLNMYQAGSRIMIHDTRPAAMAPLHLLDDLPAQLYIACDEVHSAEALARRCSASAAEVQAALDNLGSRKLIVEMEGRYLSLGVFRNRPVREHSVAEAQPEASTREPLVTIGQA
jgi:ribosomal peptide maturation radical SAM protein 1